MASDAHSAAAKANSIATINRSLISDIESALDQGYRNTEVIVVDDGSTDQSREIISTYSGKIVPILKENGGQASAFNAGFAASRGELVSFLDSDDIWLTGKIDEVVDAANSNPRAAMIYHQYRYLYDETKTFSPAIVNVGIYDTFMSPVVPCAPGSATCPIPSANPPWLP
jgi:glycosyltransferase involved in cell wall biosynthesis